jgi:uncharacterized protein YqjF (DUF2071 family)
LSDEPQGRHQWRSLLFVHWEIPVERLRALVPKALTLDTFEGKAYVGLVPFTMPLVQPLRWLPVRVGFHETNVRTYVTLDGQPGVWFFSLDAASSLAVRAARGWFHLPYHRADMTLDRRADRVRYQSERRWPEPVPATLALEARVEGALPPPQPGSLEHFLVERYLLYSERGGDLYRGRVRHQPYPLRRAEILSLDESIVEAVGLGPRGARTPALFSDGVDVDVFPIHRVTLEKRS